MSSVQYNSCTNHTIFTLYLVWSLSYILLRGTLLGAMKWASFPRYTPLRNASSSSVVGGNSSFIHACIHLKMKKYNIYHIWSSENMDELLQNSKIFGFSQLFLQYKVLQLKFWGIALINGKYIKHGHSIMNGSTTWNCNGKGLLVPSD